jgi:hypothetical protein
MMAWKSFSIPIGIKHRNRSFMHCVPQSYRFLYFIWKKVLVTVSGAVMQANKKQGFSALSLEARAIDQTGQVEIARVQKSLQFIRSLIAESELEF